MDTDRSARTRSGELVADAITHRFGDGPRVLTGVSFSLRRGEMVGLVGPSGSGKSTLARVLAGRIAPSGGRVNLNGTALSTRRGRMSSAVALIGQSPRAATNPRWSLRRSIGEPSRLRAGSGAMSVAEAARAVLLDDALLDRTPSRVSDGQLQRACIARALTQGADYVICDEPTSMLDPLTTATIVDVLRGRARAGCGILVISHDHRLLRACADTVHSLSGGSLDQPGMPSKPSSADPGS